MNSNSMNTGHSISRQTTGKNAGKESLLSIPKVNNNEVNQRSESNVWQVLASKYDVRNATFEEIVDMANSLYKVGEIALEEVATLTFDNERATNHIKQLLNRGVLPGQVTAQINLYQTEANENGRRDWIAEFEASANEAFQYGDLISYQNHTKTANILKQLKQTD